MRLKCGQRPDAHGFGMTNSAGGFKEALDNQNKKPRDVAHPYLHILSLASRQPGTLGNLLIRNLCLESFLLEMGKQ